MGVLSTALAIAFLGKALDSGSGHFLLLLLAAVVYCLLGLAFPSKQVWLFGLVSLGSWLVRKPVMRLAGCLLSGHELSAALCSFGSGLVVTGQIRIFPLEKPTGFQHVTQIMGMLYLFIALWILSIFGNYGSIDNWSCGKRFVQLSVGQCYLLVQPLAAIYVGIKTGNASFPGFGITFIFINLCCRAISEYFWDGTHKSHLFQRAGYQLLVARLSAENIWTLQFSSDEEEMKGRSQNTLIYVIGPFLICFFA